MRCQQRDLLGLRHLVGVALDRADPMLGLTGERDDVLAAGALAGGRGGSLGGGPQPGLAEVGRVGEPGGVALDDPDAGATVAAAGDLFDPTVVEPGHRRALVLDEHLGELAAGAHRGTEHSLEHIGLDDIVSGHCELHSHSGGHLASLPRSPSRSTRLMARPKPPLEIFLIAERDPPIQNT